ncbi:hypothetical protein BKA66DRAFT_459426 [Pyrenochaeta sp. MPI-SDFR-AT-0127]|nr:hypothetical protein BKA66DRAFT_459426 [Pyrenochaeta sp. MPI-SDFR-AT-0127]
MTEPQIPISERSAYLSRIFYGATIPLLTLCIPALVTRIYVKIRPWKFGVDDVFIIIGFILALVDWALLLSVMFPTARLITQAKANQGIRLAFIAIPIWSLAMACIKTAVALTFLRIQSTRPWNIFLYSIIGIQAAYGIGNTLFILLQCRPIQAAWDTTLPRSYCLSDSAIRVASNLGASVNISTDILLSLAPLAFLHKLNRPLREKVVICFLMGMGVFASIASIMKTVVVREWGQPGADPWATAISICTWTILEQFLATFAACAPSLKVPIQRLLEALGISLTSHQHSFGGQHVFEPTSSTNFSRFPMEQIITGTDSFSTAYYAEIGPNDTVELSAPHTIAFPVKLAEGNGRSVTNIPARESPVHIV